jgi:hypothetical protein
MRGHAHQLPPIATDRRPHIYTSILFHDSPGKSEARRTFHSGPSGEKGPRAHRMRRARVYRRRDLRRFARAAV